MKKEAAGFSSHGANEDSYNQAIYAAALAVAGGGGILGPSPGVQPPASPPPSGMVGRPIPTIGTCESSLTPPSNPSSRGNVGMNMNISSSSNHADGSHTPPSGTSHHLAEDSMPGGGGESMSLQRQLSVLSHSLVNNLPIRAEQLLALRNEKEVSIFCNNADDVWIEE